MGTMSLPGTRMNSPTRFMDPLLLCFMMSELYCGFFRHYIDFLMEHPLNTYMDKHFDKSVRNASGVYKIQRFLGDR